MPQGDTAERSSDHVLGLLQIGQQTLGIDIDYLAEVAHIDALQPMIGRGGGALGVIAIRGTLVPVLDPFQEFSVADTPPPIAAIISRDGQTVGLAVDRVLGLRRFADARVQRLVGVGGPRLTLGTIHDKDRLVYILDAGVILARDEFPKTHANLRQALKSERAASRPCLTFEAGGVAFAVRAEAIFGTVPRQEIQDDTMASDGFLGTIRYFGRRVPIMATNEVFGIGHRPLTENFETVVLQFPDGCLLGLAADRICQIAHPADTDLKPLAFRLTSSFSLLNATLHINGVDHFVIDESRLSADETLLNVASLSRDDPKPKEQATIEETDRAKGSVVPERERYLMLQSGTDLAVRMSDVEGLREPPPADGIIPPRAPIPGLVGLFFQNDVPIPMVNLSKALGFNGQPDPVRSRVVLVRDNGLAVGFLVDRMEGIATSTLCVPRDETDAQAFDMVELLVQGRKVTRNRIDLRELSRRLVSSVTVAEVDA